MDAELNTGRGLDKGVNQGPIINKRQFDRVSIIFLNILKRILMIQYIFICILFMIKERDQEQSTKQMRKKLMIKGNKTDNIVFI